MENKETKNENNFSGLNIFESSYKIFYYVQTFVNQKIVVIFKNPERHIFLAFAFYFPLFPKYVWTLRKITFSLFHMDILIRTYN